MSKNKRVANHEATKATEITQAQINELTADRQDALLSRVIEYLNGLRDEIKNTGGAF
jgi:hypothetical protein